MPSKQRKLDAGEYVEAAMEAQRCQRMEQVAQGGGTASCVRNGAAGDWSARRQGELSDRRLAAAPDGMTYVLGRTVVKLTTKPNHLYRSRLWLQLAPVSWPQQLHLALSSGAGRDQACPPDACATSTACS